MTKKFTFLLMALLALAGFKSWGQQTITVDFESGIPSGWTITDASSDGTWSITTDNNHTSGGSQALCSQSYYATNDMFISPQITLGDGYWMSFYALSTWGYEEPFDIAISTTNTDPSSFTTIQDHSWGFWESSWKQFTVELGEYAGQAVYIAIRRYQSWGISLLIDDIAIEAAPAIHAITLMQPEDQDEIGTFEVNPTEARKDTRINLYSHLKQYDSYGYKFVSWTVAKTDDPATTVTVNHDWQSDYFTMPDYPVTVSAEYEPETYYALTIDNGIEHGYVYADPDEHITAGTEVNLNQNADEGYELDEWNVYYTENPEQTIDVESSYYGASFEMPTAAVTVSATFKAKERYTVAIETIGNGTVSLIDAPEQNEYYEGQQVKFNVTPAAGYMIGEVTYTYGGQAHNISYDSYWGCYQFYMPGEEVTINASFIMGIMLHNSTNYWENIPVLGAHTHEFNTKSQFIYPASELQAIEGTKITDLTFYVNDGNYYMPSDCSFSPLTWNVFMKEVDYTTQHNFTNWDNMTSVYYGTITVSSYKLTIHLSTPFEYNGGNLMIGFRQNEYGDVSQWLQWYGENTDEYYSIATDWDASLTTNTFLPKTTIIYEPIVKYDITLTKPDVEVGTIAAYANGVEVSRASEGTEITLQYNFNLGYRFLNWIVNGEPIQGNTFTMPATAVTVAANFEALTQYNINCATLDEGTIHAEYNGVTISEAPAGTEITLVAVPNTGYSFDHFIVNGAPIDGNTYTMPDSEITVSATFLLAHTVYNGLDDNHGHPFYVYYADDFTKSNMIMPAADLADMAGGTISSMKFYVSRITDNLTCYSTWQVYLKEVDENETSAPIDVTTATKVYEGVIDFKVDEVIINFTEPFAYNGGNLLIATQNTTDISYSHVYFYGSDNAYGYNCSGYNSDDSSLNNITTWPQNKKSKFLPKTTFIYTPGATRYNVTCDNEITGGSISADPVKAAAGTVVNLSATPAFGYEFGAWVEDYEDVTIENNQFTMPEHEVYISATFSELLKYDIISAIVTGGTVHAEYNDETITKAFAGTEITLVAEAAEGYIFEYFTVDGVQIEGNTYTMGTSAIEIGASFRQLQSYTINYYVNGEIGNTLQCREDQCFNIDAPTAVPAGTTFAGWSREDITTYQTTEPVFVGNTEHPTEDCSLYAVLSYSEMGGATAWTKVTDFSELQNGDKVVIAAMDGENTGYTLNESCEFTGSATCSALPATFGNSGATIAALPEGTTQFTVGLNTIYANYLSLTGENGDLVHWDYNLNVPAGAEPETTDNWFEFYDSKLVADYTSDWDELYVILHNYDSYGETNMRFGIDEISAGWTYAAYLYKQQGALATYYMTEVFVIDEATSLTEDMTKRNVIIADGASLNINANVTLNVAGACFNPSHDATKFVVAEGGQLVHHNEGTVATFEKNITGYTNAQGNDGYYLIANPTDNTTVANLASNNYDLYTFNPAGDEQGREWINEKANPLVESEKGYLYANSGATTTLEFAGKLIPAASKAISLTYAGDDNDFPGFNLIGNPFACNATISGTGLRSSNYYYMMNAGGTALEVVVNPILAPCTGVFAVAANSDATVTFTQANTNGIDVTRSEKNAVQDIRVELLANGKVIDRAYLNMNGESLPKFRLQDNISEICFYQDKEELAVVSTSSTSGEIPVSFKAEKNGSYTINVNTENVEAQYLHLIDNMTGMDTDLLSTSSYTFNASTSDYAYRFKLVFSMTGVENNQSNANSYAYISNGNLVIDHIEGEATMQIVDMLGRVVSTEIVSGSYNKALNLKAGLYIINLNGMTQKIVVK